MDLQTLRQQLEAGTVHQTYLIVGESAELQRQVYETIENATIDPDVADMAVHTFDGEQTAIQEMIGSMQTPPFMGGKRLIHVKNFCQMEAAHQLDIAEACQRLIPENTVVLTSNSALDRRRKGIQLLLKIAQTIDTASPEDGQLVQWLVQQAAQRDLVLSRANAQLLIGRAGTQVDYLARELDKLASYADSQDTITKEMIRTLVTPGTPEAAQWEMFQLCDAIAEGRMQEALASIHTLLINGTHCLAIVTMLSRHFRQLLAIKQLNSVQPQAVRSQLKLKAPPFAIQRMIRQTNRYNTTSLEQASILLLEADLQLKQSAPERVTLERVAMQLMQLASA